MVHCTYCGSLIPEGAQFCANCGKPCPAENPNACKHCGFELMSGQVFCPRCGARRQEEEAKGGNPAEIQTFSTPFDEDVIIPVVGEISVPAWDVAGREQANIPINNASAYGFENGPYVNNHGQWGAWGRDRPVFLERWQTNVGLTVLGIAINLIVDRATYAYLDADIGSAGVAMAIGIFQVVFVVFSIVYAASIYPSLFTETPKAQNPKVVSFLNGLFGYIIFGLIWNSNLTKRVKGISHIVFIVIIIVIFVISFMVGLLN